MAALLVRDYGVYNALNLDGGGSTSMTIAGRMMTSGGARSGLESGRHVAGDYVVVTE